MAYSNDAEGLNARGIAAGRLSTSAYEENFSDLHPALSAHEAIIEADRCYFCFDAPCMDACPTSIDVPLFIRQIQTGNPNGAAQTIFDQNILGGMCARVCPTETLCEQVCVRGCVETQPVRIGALQRYATDHAMNRAQAGGPHPYSRAPDTGRRIAVVGAGPAGLACAHRLARYGHQVTIFDGRDKPGGLSEYGIAAYKTINEFAQSEVAFVLGVGGITLETGKTLGDQISLNQLQREFDAVFLGLGLGGVNGLGIEGEDLTGVENAVDYIAKLRQANDLDTLPVGREVVVIGGGMTAIDVAVQCKLLGARDVTIAYRRASEAMGASQMERDLAQSKGVAIKYNLQPLRILGDEAGAVRTIELEYTAADVEGKLSGTGETIELAADMVFKAIGQTFQAAFGSDQGAPAPELERGRIKVDADFATSVTGVWAGGDCIVGGDDLTVAAVDDGRRAAIAIHETLSAQAKDKAHG